MSELNQRVVDTISIIIDKHLTDIVDQLCNDVQEQTGLSDAEFYRHIVAAEEAHQTVANRIDFLLEDEDIDPDDDPWDEWGRR